MDVIANYSSHKFVWYHGEPQDYKGLLRGSTIQNATAYAGRVYYCEECQPK